MNFYIDKKNYQMGNITCLEAITNWLIICFVWDFIRTQNELSSVNIEVSKTCLKPRETDLTFLHLHTSQALSISSWRIFKWMNGPSETALFTKIEPRAVYGILQVRKSKTNWRYLTAERIKNMTVWKKLIYFTIPWL